MIGIGLVYQGTGHRHNAEVLLSEIGEYIFIYINTNIYIKIYLHKYIYIYIFFPSLGRPPGPEMEYCTDRESYSLAAGLALGMVCLGVSHVTFKS